MSSNQVDDSQKIIQAIPLNDKYICLLLKSKEVEIWNLNQVCPQSKQSYICKKQIQTKEKPSLISYSSKHKKLILKVCKLKIEQFQLSFLDENEISVRQIRSIHLNIKNQNNEVIRKIEQTENYYQNTKVIVTLWLQILILNQELKTLRIFYIEQLLSNRFDEQLFNYDIFEASIYVKYFNYQNKTNNQVLITGYSRQFALLNVLTGIPTNKVEAHDATIKDMKFIRIKGNIVYYQQFNNLLDLQIINTIIGKWDILITSSNDKTIKIWDLTSLCCLRTLKEFQFTKLIEYIPQQQILMTNQVIKGKQNVFYLLKVWRIIHFQQKQLKIQYIDKIIKLEDIQCYKQDKQQLKTENTNAIKKEDNNILAKVDIGNINKIVFHGKDIIFILLTDGSFFIQRIQIDNTNSS